MPGRPDPPGSRASHRSRMGSSMDDDQAASATDPAGQPADRWRDVVEGAPDPIWIVAPNAGIGYINPAGCRLLQRRAEEVLGRHEHEFQPAADRVGRVEAHGQAPEGAAAQRAGHILRADGSLVPVEFQEAMLGDGRRLVIARDVRPWVDAYQSLRESEERYRNVVENAADVIYTLDPHGKIISVNAAMMRTYGFTPEEVRRGELTCRDFIAPQHQDAALQRVRQFLHGDPDPAPHELLTRTRGGRSVWLEVRTHSWVDGDNPVGTQSIGRDITERKRMEEALRESEERLRTVVSNAPMILLVTDAAGRYTLCEGHGLAALGLRPGELVGQTVFQRHRDTPQGVERWRRALAGETLTVTVQAKDADLIYESHLTPVRDAGGAVTGVICVGIDITERRRAEAALERMAQHDALTGLPNRTLLMDRIGVEVRHAGRSRALLGVLLLDLNRFKTINDTLGHVVGDHLLKGVAERLVGCLRASDTVARLGGDEFVILVPGLDDGVLAAEAARRILAALAEPFHFDGHELHAAASIGISLYPSDGADAGTLLKQADTAMYRAKAGGGGRYELYRAEMSAAAADRLRMENQFRRALADNQFVVHYQPQVHIRTGDLLGLEALVRWQHPERGLVFPGTFIPLAEETGLIVPLGEWVLRTACAQARAWRDEGLSVPRLAVNVSVQQLRRLEFATVVPEILRETGWDPAALELEITESAAIADPERTVQVLSALRASGIRHALDDFGTGYSSLAELKRLPLDTLKLAQPFVQDMESDLSAREIVTAIVGMGQALGFTIVAEGVETPGQLALLRTLDCDAVQGYLVARPAPADVVTAWLRSGTRFLDAPEHAVA